MENWFMGPESQNLPMKTKSGWIRANSQQYKQLQIRKG